jgi:hypothetical protein
MKIEVECCELPTTCLEILIVLVFGTCSLSPPYTTLYNTTMILRWALLSMFLQRFAMSSEMSKCRGRTLPSFSSFSVAPLEIASLGN